MAGERKASEIDGVQSRGTRPHYGTIEGMETSAGFRYEADYKLILLPFCCLRKVQKASIVIPKSLCISEAKLKQYTLPMERQEPFGMFQNPRSWKEGKSWDDKFVQKRLDFHYLQFEYLLDVLKGSWASHLRMLRFIDWFKKIDGEPSYFENWERIYQSGIRIVQNHWKILENRYLFMIAFNPTSPRMMVVRRGLDVNPEITCRTGLGRRWHSYEFGYHYAHVSWKDAKGSTDAQKRQALAYKDRFATREEWFNYFNDGIPPLDDDQTRRELRELMAANATDSDFRKLRRRIGR